MTDSQILSRSKYNLKLIAFSIIVTGLIFAAGYIVPAEYTSSAAPFLGVFFLGLTFLIHKVLTGPSITMTRFINTYMMVTVVKLLLFLSILLVYALVRKEDALAFSIAFFAFYLFFSVFEIVHLLLHHKGKNN